MWQEIRTFAKKYEQHWTSVAFLLGFIWDNLTLTRVDLLYDNIVLTSYIIIAGASIIIFHAHGTGKLRLTLVEKISRFLPLVIQFAFGGLFSGYVVYYSRSGSLVESWPFIIFLLALFIGNELFKKRYQLLTFQIGIFFIAVFSYFTFSIPVLLRAIGPWIFILSGLVSVLVVVGLLYLLSKIVPDRFAQSRGPIMATLFGIYALFNFAYFTNLIPPIPLSIKHIGVYHSVIKLPSGDYELAYEPAPWYRPFKETSSVFHAEPNYPVYVLSSIYAPKNLNASIVHEWSRYDEGKKEWVEATTVAFEISGGRSEGYRAYTYKTNTEPGIWRVTVKTRKGQVLGRIKFTIAHADAPYKLRSRIK